MKYGLNPHQSAKLISKMPFDILNGIPSTINILDATYSYNLCNELSKILNKKVVASYKHTSPAGVAINKPLSKSLREMYNLTEEDQISDITLAFIRAKNSDPKSSFGDFLGFSHEVDIQTANLIKEDFSNGIIAPSYSDEALEVLKNRNKFLILKVVNPIKLLPKTQIREIWGMKIEEEINNYMTPNDYPTDIIIANQTLKYTQSNSIVMAYDGQVIGVGAGQQSRIDCVRIACNKSKNWFGRMSPEIVEMYKILGGKKPSKINEIYNYLSLSDMYINMNNISLASDGFFPFTDSIKLAKNYGVTEIIQPGGSINDRLIQKCCDKHNITQYISGTRLFMH